MNKSKKLIRCKHGENMKNSIIEEQHLQDYFTYGLFKEYLDHEYFHVKSKILTLTVLKNKKLGLAEPNLRDVLKPMGDYLTFEFEAEEQPNIYNTFLFCCVHPHVEVKYAYPNGSHSSANKTSHFFCWLKVVHPEIYTPFMQEVKLRQTKTETNDTQKTEYEL